MSRSDEEDFIDNLSDDNVHLSIYAEDELIGNMVLKEKEEGVGELGLMIHPNHHSKGYGTDAARTLIDHGFNQMRYHRIYARVFANNAKSKGVWEKLGFTEEGLMREHIFVDGDFVDAHIYGLLEDEWDN
jgi:RimJ/RimL family protein N-acetyltransferase